jgi:hypothetical protein
LKEKNMSDLHITIKGLALCRPVGSMTQILFPHAPKHSLKLTIFNGTDIIDEVFTPQGFMTMTRENGVKCISPPPPPLLAVNKLINLNDLPGGAFIQLKTRNTVKIPVSYLSIPTANLFSCTKSGKPHEMWVKKTGGPTPTPQRQYLGDPPYGSIIDDEVTVCFRIPDTDPSGVPALKLKIEQPFDRLYTFEHTVNPKPPYNVRNFEVTFDNHCYSDGVEGGADFGYYYEIIDAIDPDTHISYEIEEFPINRPLPGQTDSIAACNAVIGDPGKDLGIWHHGG